MANHHGLTEKQEAFCQHYVVSKNSAASCRKAGYSDKIAKTQGYKLLQEEKIQERIKELEGSIVLDIDVIHEAEENYKRAKAAGRTNDEYRYLELLAKVRGNQPDDIIEKDLDTIEGEIIRAMEILGERKVKELVEQCNWHASVLTDNEEEIKLDDQ